MLVVATGGCRPASQPGARPVKALCVAPASMRRPPSGNLRNGLDLSVGYEPEGERQRPGSRYQDARTGLESALTDGICWAWRACMKVCGAGHRKLPQLRIITCGRSTQLES